MHKGFYVQHNFESTHQLTQATPGPPRLVPMYNMSRAREITFDYGCSVFERLYELDGDTQNTSTSETSLSVSLSAGFQDSLVEQGTGGLDTTRELWRRLEARDLRLASRGIRLQSVPGIRSYGGFAEVVALAM